MADFLMGDQEETEEQEEAFEFLEKAADEFNAALVHVQEQASVPVLCKLGETKVHMGNLTDKEEDQENAVSLMHYKEAVTCFKKVLAIDADLLPEQFVEFVQDWEADIDALI